MSPYVVPDSRLASVQLERKTDNLPKTLTPTFWAELTIVPFDSLIDPAQSNATPNDDVSAESSSQESMDTGTALSKLADPQPPHVPHEHFFFDDGNITFLVEGTLYRVHRYFFCRDSSDFKDRLSRLSTQLESTPDSPPVIQLDDVKSVDFEAFLSVLYPQNFNTIEERSFEEWSSILDLSTRWGFAGIRNLAIRCLKPPSPLRRLLLARKYAVEEWVNPALLELCERPEPLSLDEARHMNFEDVVLVGSVRQNVRSTTLATDGAGIRDCIQAWRNGEPWSRPPTPVTPVGSPAPTPPAPASRSSASVNPFATRQRSTPATLGSVSGVVNGRRIGRV